VVKSNSNDPLVQLTTGKVVLHMPYKILVVDDEPPILRLMEFIRRRIGGSSSTTRIL